MNNVAIRVENLAKMYRIGTPMQRPQNAWQASRNLLTSPVSYLLRSLRRPTEEETLWALKDCSFELNRGEVLGVIGSNGAGKSTLLKLLARITEPTHGSAQIYGRVGSLLEVGTGFHPELTGRENVYMNGAVLGMRKSEIDRKFDEIVDFSGVEKFIDTPIKRYSSGMNVRLAFGVAAHLDPEILLIDEVLAVGDVEFQKKCLDKMREVTREGRTILFVSHNMTMIQTLCPESLLLTNGRVQTRGPSSNVVATYIQDRTQNNGEYVWNHSRKGPSEPGPVVPISLRLLDNEGDTAERVFSRFPTQIEFKYRITEQLSNLYILLRLGTSQGQIVCDSYDEDSTDEHEYVRRPGVYLSRCTIPENLLNDKTYVLSLTMGVKGVQIFFQETEVVRFSVDIAGGLKYEGRSGLIRPRFEWSTTRQE